MFLPKLLSLIPVLLLACGAGSVNAADVDAHAGYLVSLGGINIADGEVTLTDSGGRYSVEANAHVTGLGSLVASGTAKAQSSGASTPSGLSSESFDLLTHANGEDFDSSVSFAHGDVSGFKVTPPLVDNVNRVPIERSQLTGVGDIIAGVIAKGSGLTPALCDRHLRIFTGVERFDLGMSFLANDKATSLRTGYQGPVVQCQLKYTPISGRFTTSDSTNYLAQSNRIFLWYAPLGSTGYYIPYRLLLTTSVGDLSMVLTSLKD